MPAWADVHAWFKCAQADIDTWACIGARAGMSTRFICLASPHLFLFVSSPHYLTLADMMRGKGFQFLLHFVHFSRLFPGEKLKNPAFGFAHFTLTQSGQLTEASIQAYSFCSLIISHTKADRNRELSRASVLTPHIAAYCLLPVSCRS